VPGIAEVFVRLVPQLDKRDVEKQLDSVDAKAAGKKAGKDYGDALGTEVGKATDKVAADAEGKGKEGGRRFGLGFGAAFGSSADVARAGDKAGDTAGKSFAAKFGQHVKNIMGGIGPGVLGVGAKPAAITAGIGGAAGLLPALFAGGATVALGGAGAGLIDIAAKQLIGTKNVKGKAATEGPLYDAAQQIKTTFTDAMQQAVKPMQAPLAAAFKQIPGMLKSVTPALQAAFAGAATLIQPLLHGISDLAHDILPGLGAAFRAAAPLLRPLLDGIGQLVKGLLPGLVALLHAAAPAVTVLAGFLGSLGSSLGGMLRAMAPAVAASAALLKAVGGVITSLLPVVASLAASFATALAPAFTALAGALKALNPVFDILGRFIAQFAGAVIGDLSSAITAVVTLLTRAGPALGAFFDALGKIFNVMESAGVFATLGNAVEMLAAPLGNLVAVLIRGLVPILPPVINFIGQLATIIAAGLANGVVQLLPPLTQLATVVLQALANVLPVILPVLTAITTVLSAAFVRVISDLATALSAIITAIPPPVLEGIAVAIAAIVGALKLWAVIQAVLDIELSPFIAVMIMIGAVVAVITIAVVELVKHWGTVWAFIKRITLDAWGAIYNEVLAPLIRFFTKMIPDAFNATITWAKEHWPLLVAIIGGPVGAIVALVITHWNQISSFLARVWHDITALAVTVWNGIAAFFAGWWNREVTGWTNIVNWLRGFLAAAWGAIRATAVSWWNGIASFFTGWWDNEVAGWTRIIGTLKGLLSGAWADIRRVAVAAWAGIASAIGTAWNAVQNAVKGPIKWVIHFVLNDALIKGFNLVSHAVGGPHIGNIPETLAAGGRITAGTGPTADDVPVWVSRGETVVSAAHSAQLAPAFARVGVPGYQTGGVPLPPGTPATSGTWSGSGGTSQSLLSGIPGGGVLHNIGQAASNVWRVTGDVGKIILAIATGNAVAAANAFFDMIGKKTGGAIGDLAGLLVAMPARLVHDVVSFLMGMGGGATGSGADIANFAATFIGKIPYTWGGATLTAADCSGFVQAVYKHFGIDAPRTSEAQGAWVTRGPPVAGGLALYHSPPGGPDPGHVAIVRNAMQVISQGGGMGPQLMPIHAMPLLWTGTPPGGFGGGGAVSGTVGQWIRMALSMAGAPLSWAAWMGTLVSKESGGNPRAVNPQTAGMSGEHAEGIAQTIPSTFAAFALPGHGNIWNPVDDLIASVRYIRATYGSPASIPGLGAPGNYVGYDGGGPIPEPVFGIGPSGTFYQFHANEDVLPAGGAGALLAELRAIRGLLGAAPGRTAAGVAAGLAAHTGTMAQAARLGAR